MRPVPPSRTLAAYAKSRRTQPDIGTTDGIPVTNIIESTNAVIRQVCRNVKRWRDAKMALRWTAAGMIEAAKGFRRLKARTQLPVLKAALLQHREPGATGVDQTAEAA